MVLDQANNALQLIRRADFDFRKVVRALPELADVPPLAIRQLEIEAKYEGYIHRQQGQVEKHRRLEGRPIPEDMDYDVVRALSNEGREKLQRIRPVSVGQAARIPGVTPADVSILLVWLEANRRREAAGAATAVLPVA